MVLTNCITKQRIEACRLYFKTKVSADNRIVNQVFNWSILHGRSLESRCKKLIHSLGLEELINQEGRSVKFKTNYVKQKLVQKDIDSWRTKLFNDSGHENGNKLRTYRLYKTHLTPEPYVKLNMDRSHRRVLAKFRSGSLPLHIETGRYSKPKVPLNERTCKFCSQNAIEDEIHFLMDCEFYSDIRRSLIVKANTCNTDFNSLSKEDRFIFIMNYINLQHSLSYTLVQMFNRRKRML